MNTHLVASPELIAASSVVILFVGMLYILVYRLRRQQFFALMGAAWFLNLIYLGTEAKQISFLPHSTLAISVAAVSYAAFFFWARYSAFLPSRLELWLTASGFLVSVVALSLPAPLALSQNAAFLLRDGPTIVLTAWLLLRLGVLILRLNPKEMLQLLGSWDLVTMQGSQLPYQGSAASPEAYHPVMSEDLSLDWFSESSYRSLNVGRSLLAVSLLGYGLLQFLYPLKQIDSPFTPFLFWAALVLKFGNGIGVAFLLLGDFRVISEAIRVQSLTVELAVFTASIEHDIRNPLSTIEKIVFLLKKRYQHDSSLMAQSNEITRQLGRIKSVVDVIPELRETREYYANRFHRWNLVEIIKTAANSVIKSTEHRINIASSSTSIFVIAYRDRLIQSFVNIFNNSIEAFAARNSLALIEVSVKSDGVMSVTTVRDEAGGIPVSLLNLVARPLFSTKTSGTANRGLGLFTAKHFVEQHQGTLSINSDGSMFTEIIIELPVAAKERARRGES